VSLILEALKKLEREKPRPEHGFVVVAHLPWALGSRRRWWPWVLLLALSLALVVPLWWWQARGTSSIERRPSPSRAAETPWPQPSARPVGSPPPTVRLPAAASLPAPAEPHGQPAGETQLAPTPATPIPRTAETETHAPEPSAAGARWPQLTAISRRDGRPVALLDDRLVYEGDLVDGVRVLRIGAAEVEVARGELTRVLRFQ
jgi:hypothetical protein